MTKLQKKLIIELVVGIILFILVGSLIMFKPIFLLMTTLVGGALFISLLIITVVVFKFLEVYYMRGALTEEEYKYYTLNDDMIELDGAYNKSVLCEKISKYMESHSKLSRFVNKYW